jgi:hypothetical protein
MGFDFGGDFNERGGKKRARNVSPITTVLGYQIKYEIGKIKNWETLFSLCVTYPIKLMANKKDPKL